MNNDTIKNIHIKLDRLDRKQKYLVKMSELSGKQEALISVLDNIIHTQMNTKRKTVDIDTVRDMLTRKIEDNSKAAKAVMQKEKGDDKIIHIEEFEKWTTLK